MIAIVDYGLGNINAFSNIYKNLNMPYIVAKSSGDLVDVTNIILPGVGSFDHAMGKLQKSGMREKLDELVLDRKIPVIGICVGMQMLADSSEEGKLPGLGWISGDVKKIDIGSVNFDGPLPHMGWNTLQQKQQTVLFKNIEAGSRFYFLHSYYFSCSNEVNSLATTNYMLDFTSVVGSENIYGVQFHPEKSHGNGVGLLQRFGELQYAAI